MDRVQVGTPPPGSPEAIELGCLCAVIDNNYGRGFVIHGYKHWVYNQECPIHGGNDGGDGSGS